MVNSKAKKIYASRPACSEGLAEGVPRARKERRGHTRRQGYLKNPMLLGKFDKWEEQQAWAEN